MDISIQERWLAAIHFLLDIEYGEGKFKKHHAWLPPFYWIWGGPTKKNTMYNQPLTTAMTDGCTLNPSVQAESTLFGYFAANTKKANFSLFKYTLRYIDVQEGGTPAGRGDSNKSRPLRFLPPLRYSSSSKYGVRKKIWIQSWFIQYQHFLSNNAIFSILV